MANSKQRASNFELMRIFAIFLIIIFHTLDQYVINQPPKLMAPIAHNVELYGSILALRSVLGNTGNILFAMISGYFLIKSSNITFFSRAGKTLNKFIPILFFNGVVVINGLAILVSLLHEKVPLLQHMNITWNFFTINLLFGYSNFWYLGSYIFLLLFIKPLNHFLQSKSAVQFLQILTLTWLIFSILKIPNNFLLPDERILQILFGYIAGAAMRLHNPFKKVSVPTLLLIVVSYFIVFMLLFEINARVFHTSYLKVFPEMGIFIYFVPILVFEMFSRLSVKSKFINLIAPTTLYIYVFHLSLPFNLFQKTINHVRGPIFSSLEIHNKYLADLFFWGTTFVYAFIIVLTGAVLGLFLTLLISKAKKHLSLFDWNNI